MTSKRREKLTVTVRITLTGSPFSSVGRYRQALTAATAAPSSSGWPRTTVISETRPSVVRTHSRTTDPWTRVDSASGG